MNDDDGGSAVDAANFKKDRGRVRTDDHGESVSEISDPDRVA
jgi:hypothetical protein